MPGNRNTDWQSIPVWRCSEVNCGEQWATWEENSPCPVCEHGPGQRAGFTYGDVARAADKFGFEGDLPVHISEPVPDLVQISTLPQETWIGLPVFHPLSQEGTRANWFFYDVGVIVEVYEDPDFQDNLRCRFVISLGMQSGTLEYSPSNLWVPRALANRLV